MCPWITKFELKINKNMELENFEYMWGIGLHEIMLNSCLQSLSPTRPLSLIYLKTCTNSLQSFIFLTNLLLTYLWIVISASFSLLSYFSCTQVFIYQHMVLLLSWIIPISPLGVQLSLTHMFCFCALVSVLSIYPWKLLLLSAHAAAISFCPNETLKDVNGNREKY